MKKSFFRSAFSSLALVSCSALAQEIDYSQPYLMADQPDSWQPYVGATYSYDNNLLRTPNALIDGQPTSDTSWTREAGIGFDRTYSRQHITVNLDIYRTTFERYNFIDYEGKDAALDWNWGVTNDFTGEMGITYTESLTPFTQFHLAQRNLRSQRTDFFNGYWHLSPTWQLHSLVSNLALNYDLASQQSGDRRIHSNNVGLDFVSDQGNVLGIVAQRDEAGYPFEQLIFPIYVNNNYVEDSLKGNLDWTVSGLTHIQLSGGWARREFAEFSARNASGPTARLTASYVATGKTSLILTAWRDLDASDYLTVQYTVDKGISFMPVWDPVDKIRVTASIKHESFDYTNSSAFTALLPQNRIDTLREENLSVVYTPLRKIQTSLVLYTDRLDSNIPGVSYRDKGLVLNARIAF